MATVPSPNMSLPVPVVGVEVGPAWASDLNVCLSTLDGHNHAPGSGVQINPAGININADLSFGVNNATQMRTVRFSAQGASLTAAADRACLYVVGNELFYNDGGGTVIPITNTGSVNAGAGSITGLPSGTAGVSYSSGTYKFAAATNTPANLDGLNITLRNNVASGSGLTLSAPTLSSNYTLVLPYIPSTAPNGGKIMALDTSGNITAAVDVDNTTLQYSSNTLLVKSGGITTTQISSTAGIIGTQLSSSANILGTQLSSHTVAEAQITANTITNASINPATLTTQVYTPTATSLSNCTSVAFSRAQAMRVINVATVTGTVTFSVTTSGPFSFRLNVPFASGVFSASDQVAGVLLDPSTPSFGNFASAGGTQTIIMGGIGVAGGTYGAQYTYTYQIP